MALVVPDQLRSLKFYALTGKHCCDDMLPEHPAKKRRLGALKRNRKEATTTTETAMTTLKTGLSETNRAGGTGNDDVLKKTIHNDSGVRRQALAHPGAPETVYDDIVDTDKASTSPSQRLTECSNPNITQNRVGALPSCKVNAVALPKASSFRSESGNVNKSRDKFGRSIKHELDRLQPSNEDLNANGRRKLRSADNTRLKSQLSDYFPEYDQIIGNDPKEEYILDLKTPIVIVNSDDAAEDLVPYVVLDFPSHLATSFEGLEVETTDFAATDKQIPQKHLSSDPLADSMYDPFHRRQARLEMSIRKIEKQTAQFEKGIVEQLLVQLQSEHWLPVLGINGVATAQRIKKYMPARAYFISGCQNILAKFKSWAEQERGLRHDRAASNSTIRSPTPPKRGLDGTREARCAKRVRHHESKKTASVSYNGASMTCSQSTLRNHKASEPMTRLGTSIGARSSPGGKSSTKQGNLDNVLHGGMQSLSREESTRAKYAASKGAALSVVTPSSPPPSDNVTHPLKSSEDLADCMVRPTAWGYPIPDLPQIDFSLPKELLNPSSVRALRRRRRQVQRDQKGC